MKKHAFHIAFALGALAVLWVAAAVASTHLLVLVMTSVIAAVYVFGALELRHYRTATAQLAQALTQVPADLQQLGDWMQRVPASLQNAVRQRIEGERSALPGPALTPYLVGLLVMLGMLGTFLGMVVTLNGAVFALEGTSSVQGMRAAFSEPIRGLGLAFGTSVAGVATSAMLGLMSSLSRRERAQAAQTLDGLIGSGLRHFSLAHQRLETFKALQQQSQALPLVVQQLQTLMTQMERHSQQLGERLLSHQDSFHREVKTAYTELAQSVDQTMRRSLSESMQLASDSIRPVVQATMSEMAQQAQTQHERMVGSTREQLDTLNQQFASSAHAVAQTWAAALAQHDQRNAELQTGMQHALAQYAQTFDTRANALVQAVRNTWTEQQSRHDQADQERLQGWKSALQDMAAQLQSQWQHAGQQTLAQQQAVCDTLTQTAQAVTSQVQSQARQTMDDIARLQATHMGSDQERLVAWQSRLQEMASTLQTQWQQATQQTLAQQQQVCDALDQTAQQIRSDSTAHSTQTLSDITRLLASSEELVRARIAAEAEAATQHTRRAEELATLLRTELSALRETEAQRGEAAVARLAELQTAVTAHLSTLGTALEDPIARLIETASEAPKAAAEVIGQLRQEISVSVARDNALLEERTRILGTLSTLLDAINHASTEQRSVIDTLVQSSKASLSEASSQFQAHVTAETGKLGDIAAQVTASAVDVASLGETFGFAVRSFNETNEKLIANLQRIEAAIGQSMARSDEQLAYYVAQAREIIDLSIDSQKDVLEALQQRQAQGAA
ncbi:MAG: DUF802 domain-containing protein [Limnohabitans sp.]|nr:MAG: DUF802 domain-containing protein [Limnohabitans sp.]